MIKLKNNKYEVGVTVNYKHYIYHFRYLKFQKRWDIGRQYL